ncbi:hypothetical protein [Achromobacter kerstersii]|jgi:hypothetical protein|uniref:Uncharacterized protein n=1 Tax=Achromobacter kerstersii TaxID=1353890 RepID=A0A6S7A012_9BURK|nr:hypothetical protein [Achromobacter kerstersii]CAB3703608.1 hypothetical protein LMG3441_02705 [Achromobacter kerstersii]CUJ40920.1 Uncharacterised protein [Achromobacter kerstersii]
MKTWPLQDVQTQYAEFVDDDVSAGPQRLIAGGFKPSAVGAAPPRLALMAPRPTLKSLLLTDFARTEHLVPA